MTGKLILIGGLSGAGKTTLMRAAAETVDDVEILQTTTTRPMRPGEINGQEYRFVSDDEYEALRKSAQSWDHLEYHGYKYGADALAIREKLHNGTHIICTITPSDEEIRMLEQAYGVPAITIWLDVPRMVAASRISADKARAARDEPELAPPGFQYHFAPTGQLSDDKNSFASFVAKLLRSAEQ